MTNNLTNNLTNDSKNGLKNDERFNVLIVDDEYYFRKLLLNLIDWPALGFDVAGEAEDGLQALDWIERDRIDLIVADINMPQLSGLAFIEKLRERDKRAKIIFITSYDVFEYAQEAVKLGASHFLLKPVDEEQLEAVLKGIHQELTLEKESALYTESLKKQVELAFPILREGFIRRLLLQEPKESAEYLANQARFYRIAEEGHYAAAIVEIDEQQARFHKEQDRQLWRFAIKNVCEETFRSLGSSCIALDGEDRHILLFASVGDQQASALHACCEQARSFIDQKLNIQSTLAFGEIYAGLDQVHLSYAEARYALTHKFIGGGNRVIAYWEGSVVSQDAVFHLSLQRAEWLSAIRHRDAAALSAYIAELFQRLIASRASKEMAMMVLMECISIGGTAVLERGGTMPADWLTDRHPLFRQIGKLETADDMQGWIDAFFHDMIFGLLEQLDVNEPAGSSHIVRKALRHIQEHFTRSDLSLQQTARELFVNPSYLSHKFKKETGKSFVEYVSDLRLDEARKLLSEETPAEDGTMPKLNEIAWKVGYSDPYYFSKCFKKKFGVTPNKINA